MYYDCSSNWIPINKYSLKTLVETNNTLWFPTINKLLFCDKLLQSTLLYQVLEDDYLNKFARNSW